MLAFGERDPRRLPRARLGATASWTWHEAADARLFRPLRRQEHAATSSGSATGATASARPSCGEFLLEPARASACAARSTACATRETARRAVARAGLAYRGWLANHRVPEVFARHRVTVHVPRRPYVEALPGIPTIRPFEALACGIPLVSAPWDDAEGLFTPGATTSSPATARDGAHARASPRRPGARAILARHGRRTILARHTCAHRVDELLAILRELGVRDREAVPPAEAAS